jgi:hypothetical protein
MPGKYSVTLKVNGKSFTQPLTVKLDPRVKISSELLQTQFDLSKELYDARLRLEPINEELSALTAQLDNAKKRGIKEPLASQIDALTKKLMELSEVDSRRPGTQLSLGIVGRVTTLFDRLQEVDLGPTPNIVSATSKVVDDSRSIIERWKAIQGNDIPAIKQQFKLNGLPDLQLTGRQVKYRSASDEDDDDDDPRGEP